MSNTGQTAAEPLRRGEFKTPEGVVHIPCLDAGICRGDGMCFAPEGFAVEQPVTLRFREAVDLGHGHPLGIPREAIEGVRHSRPLNPF